MNEQPIEADAVHSRRAFLGRTARRAAYVTPIVVSVAAREARAGASACGEAGSPCFGQNDCCGGFNCVDGMGEMVMMGMQGTCEI